MRIVPDADPFDGKIDVCIVRPVSKWTILRMLARVFNGGHVRHPAVRIERSSWVELEGESLDGGGLTILGDGEDLTKTPCRIEAAAGAIEVIVPKPES